MTKAVITLTCVVLALAVNAGAMSLEKRHQLGLRLGMWNQITNART